MKIFDLSPNWGRLLASESQSDRVTDTQEYSIYGGGEIFLCLISINSPTHFAGRGITLKANVIIRTYLTSLVKLCTLAYHFVACIK